MDLSTPRQNRILTHVSGVRIDFDNVELSRILGIQYEDLNIYMTRKELDFNGFRHVDGVWNICRSRDFSDDVCALSFKAQLLHFQVRILYSIIQYMVTPIQGHSDEMTRLDVGLLDSLLLQRRVSLSYIILHHMLTTPAMTN